MKIYLNRVPIDGPWGGGNLWVKAFCRRAEELGHEVVHELASDIEAIMIADPREGHGCGGVREIAGFSARYRNVPIIHRVNECDARKGTWGMDELLRTTSSISDMSIFVSGWIQGYHHSLGWMCERYRVIRNGVDQNVFKPCSPHIRSGPLKIVTHHWSDNFMKGQDIYEALDRFVGENAGFEFTYIGRTKANLPNTRLVPPVAGRELGNELAQHHVYVSGSRWDPGPNHIIESIACGLVTYARDIGGGAVEFAGETHAYSTEKDLFERLRGEHTKNDDAWLTGWNECIDSYLIAVEDCRSLKN